MTGKDLPKGYLTSVRSFGSLLRVFVSLPPSRRHPGTRDTVREAHTYDARPRESTHFNTCVGGSGRTVGETGA